MTAMKALGAATKRKLNLESRRARVAAVVGGAAMGLAVMLVFVLAIVRASAPSSPPPSRALDLLDSRMETAGDELSSSEKTVAATTHERQWPPDPSPPNERFFAPFAPGAQWFFHGRASLCEPSPALREWRPLTPKQVSDLASRLQLGKSWRLSAAQVEEFMAADAEFRKRRGFEPYDFARKDFARVVHLLVLRRWISELGIYAIPGPIVESNGYNPETDYFRALAAPTSTYLDYKYESPDRGDLDVMADFRLRNVSVFIVTQTFEHVQNVHAAIRNLARATSAGGLVYANAPWINKPHMTPFHFSQFTAAGLVAAFESNGFEVLRANAWGNPAYIRKVLFEMGRRDWPDFRDMAREFDSPSSMTYAQVALLARRRSYE